MENVNKAERIVEYFFCFFFSFFLLNLSFRSFIFFWYRSQVFLGRKIKLGRKRGGGARERKGNRQRKDSPADQKENCAEEVPTGGSSVGVRPSRAVWGGNGKVGRGRRWAGPRGTWAQEGAAIPRPLENGPGVWEGEDGGRGPPRGPCSPTLRKALLSRFPEQ